MTLRAELEAIAARQDVTADEKRTLIADAKAEAVHVAEKPQTVEIERGRNTYALTIASVRRRSAGIVVDLSIARNGEEVPFNGPWVIINPPCMVEDPQGDIVRFIRGPKTKEVTERRYRIDPAAAFREMLRDLVMGLK